MTTDRPTLLQPDPKTLVVSYHPYRDGDAVSLQFSDPERGRYVLAFSPEMTNYLATLFATAVKSPRIGAIADQIRAAQRENGA
ncbi:hypothetical protein [Mycobacterium sp. TY814]|uniref:hypothetical protein n=1 Tax=unclassified Mycobacterium TaxID=2642494 RepID=UPI002741B68F|nr:hypothetical protein [Mycobacterium sp. TY814]MDP7725093.1 hypothetical protein [Mycobacterium sp. TY814]